MMQPMAKKRYGRHILATCYASGHGNEFIFQKYIVMAEDEHWNHFSVRYKTLSPLIDGKINPAAKIIICIPVLAEELLYRTLDSLWNSRSFVHHTEVILLFNTNESITADQRILHKQVWESTVTWINEHDDEIIKFYQVDADSKLAGRGGVGWARKMLMDEAARRLHPNGIILCLDADCIVSHGYIDEVVYHFDHHPAYNAASIYFEHDLNNLGLREREAIIQYELHLRFLVHAQRWCGHPFAYYTVGSAMAVRRSGYLKQGGMNTRSAGEDFYFVQKFIETEQLFEIKSATVYPSTRISHRVPFGTGRAIFQITEMGAHWKTTHFNSFRTIKLLFESLENWWGLRAHNPSRDFSEMLSGLNETLVDYLKQIRFIEKVQEIADQTTTLMAFKKRFFRYFNAFQMIRWMHYMRDHAYPDTEIEEALESLLKAKGISPPSHLSAEGYLEVMRNLDRGD